MNLAERTKVLIGRDIRKTFRRDTGEIVHALDGVSLEVEHGTLTALVGPDGAGKTTLIRLAAGLMTADGGELKILGFDVAADFAHPGQRFVDAAQVAVLSKFKIESVTCRRSSGSTRT